MLNKHIVLFCFLIATITAQGCNNESGLYGSCTVTAKGQVVPEGFEMDDVEVIYHFEDGKQVGWSMEYGTALCDRILCKSEHTWQNETSSVDKVTCEDIGNNDKEYKYCNENPTTFSYTYNEAGQVSEIKSVYIENNRATRTANTYEYNDLGKLVSKKFFYADLDSLSETKYVYDNQQRLMSETRYSSIDTVPAHAEYVYSNNSTLEVIHSSLGKNTYKEICILNEDGNIERYQTYNYKFDRFITNFIYSYDDNGYLDKITNSFEFGDGHPNEYEDIWYYDVNVDKYGNPVWIRACNTCHSGTYPPDLSDLETSVCMYYDIEYTGPGCGQELNLDQIMVLDDYSPQTPPELKKLYPPAMKYWPMPTRGDTCSPESNIPDGDA